jgi:uncharacterized OB-fold protein
MNDRFVERLERAIARGLEKPPQETEEEARRRREHTARVNGTTCAHCGKTFVPVRSTKQYCSVRCRHAAYHQRHAPTM